MGSTDKNVSTTGYQPKDNFLTETYVEFNEESMTEQRFPEERFPEDVDYDDAAIGEMLFLMHTENKSFTPSEKACLLVSRPIERGNPLLKERRDPLLKEVRN